MSFIQALMQGEPVVFTKLSGNPPEVICPEGKEKDALELMKDMGLITLTQIELINMSNEDWKECACLSGKTVAHRL